MTSGSSVQNLSLVTLTLNMPGFLQTGMTLGGGRFCPHPHDFCLNDPIDLKFGM